MLKVLGSNVVFTRGLLNLKKDYTHYGICNVNVLISSEFEAKQKKKKKNQELDSKNRTKSKRSSKVENIELTLV